MSARGSGALRRDFSCGSKRERAIKMARSAHPLRLSSGAGPRAAGREDRRHRTALHPRRRLDDDLVANLIDDRLDLLERDLGVRDLTTAEAHRDLHLIAALNKAADMVHLEADIMVIGLRAELNLFQLDLRLALLRLGLLLLLVVFEAAVVHDLTDRGLGLRVHFDEV